MMLHAAHCIQQGHKKLCVRTVDTDVVVLSVATIHKLRSGFPGGDPSDLEMWVAFGTGKSFCYIPAHTIATNMGPTKALALPFSCTYWM